MHTTAEYAIVALRTHDACPGCHEHVHHADMTAHANTCQPLHLFVRDERHKRDDRRENDRHFPRTL